MVRDTVASMGLGTTEVPGSPLDLAEAASARPIGDADTADMVGTGHTVAGAGVARIAQVGGGKTHLVRSESSRRCRQAVPTARC